MQKIHETDDAVFGKSHQRDPVIRKQSPTKQEDTKMKIQINEVWNSTGKSVELAVIEASGNPRRAVYDWIAANRPDLDMATALYSHGFHAQEIA